MIIIRLTPTVLKRKIKRNDCALFCTLIEKMVLEYLSEHPTATQVQRNLINELELKREEK